MELYRIEAVKSDHGWAITSPAFGITVDAGEDELEDGIRALKSLMSAEAEEFLGKGLFLPADEGLDTTGMADGAVVLYTETDFGGRFLAKTSETVRRNVSMPAWMDLRLRANSIDASRLFQEAASKKLDELERASAGLHRITDVRELEAACPGKVLDEYFRDRVLAGLGIEKERI